MNAWPGGVPPGAAATQPALLPRSRLLAGLGLLALVFGAATLFAGGRALFGPPEARAAVGAAVGFVLWFNFGAGFAYLLAGAGLWLRRRWAPGLALAIALATAAVAAGFGRHVATGGAYEMRTVAALALRLGFWLLVAWVGLRAWRRSPTAPRS